ncbi:MAG: tetratricopeptide repeat protein, partial [Flavobacteriaceae bacterium]|nr:tetratricopeptide repeat protein [Flavobacteriaceae bacterium]
MAFEHSDNYGIAITKFEEMLHSNEVRFFDAEEFESIIGHYLELGRIQLAKKALSMALEQHPKSVELLLMKVEILVFDNQLDQADEILSNLHSIEPRNEEIYIQKANVFSKKGMHEKSILSLKYALELTSDPVDVLSLMGMEYMMNDRHVEAIKCFKDCLLHDPQDEAALYNIVYCYEYLQKPKKAIKFLSEYLNDFPYSETAWHQLGIIFFKSKKYRKALAAFDFAIISDDEFLGAYIEKAKTLEKLKRYEEAIEGYKITFEIDEPTAYVYMRIGRCYLKLKQKQTAVTYFKKAVKDDPLLEAGWMALTGYYFDKHDYNKALYYINKALDIDFDNVKYWKQYAYI